MFKIKYNEDEYYKPQDITDAIKFAYYLWRSGIHYKYIYEEIELVENSSWDFVELKKCIEVQIELVNKLINKNIIKKQL